MRAVEDPDPAPNPEHDEHFQGSPSWGSAPRIDAAQALMALARRSAEMAASLQPAILHLAADPVATVRFQIARHLTYLFRAAPELMWQLLERFGKEEGNRGVLQGTLDVLQQIANVDPPRIARLALDIFDRMPPEGAGVSHVRDQCSNIFAGLTIWHKEPISIATIERMIASPVDFHRDVRRVIFDLSAWIKNDDQEICKIAFALMDRVLDAQLVGMRAIEAQFEGKSLRDWPETDRQHYGELMNNADEVAMRLFLVSGASSADQASPLPVEPEFYEAAKPLLKKLTAIGHPHTAHSVIETLVYFGPVDPVGILLMIGEAVKASSAQGYHHEQLGEGLIVRMVERYLAEYRPVLREHSECHVALMEILDVFVRVGWPSAHQLTYRLGEIYR